ncbi:MAG: hypothetical protein CM15mP74_31720 [Halieaceae bacterium]|nr:MAG: hypothetical protein CM15mP74_31720 [Halieaceae bacterium]
MINVAINGYGRIGRNILRAFYERPDLSEKCRLWRSMISARRT